MKHLGLYYLHSDVGRILYQQRSNNFMLRTDKNLLLIRDPGITQIFVKRRPRENVENIFRTFEISDFL